MADLTADRLALRYLSESYAAGCDRRDISLILPVFADGGKLTVHWHGREPGVMIAPDDLERIPTGLARYDRTMHFLGNHHAEVDGDWATCQTYCFAHHITGTNDYVMAIVYEDVCRREADGWKIVTRDLRLQWTSDRSVVVG